MSIMPKCTFVLKFVTSKYIIYTKCLLHQKWFGVTTLMRFYFKALLLWRAFTSTRFYFDTLLLRHAFTSTRFYFDALLLRKVITLTITVEVICYNMWPLLRLTLLELTLPVMNHQRWLMTDWVSFWLTRWGGWGVS